MLGQLSLLATMVLLMSEARSEARETGGRFDVGGRSIHIACRGTGHPTIVVDAGLGTAPATDEGWQRIAGRIATTTRICLYDRAGLGGSDPATDFPRTSMHAAADLHEALRKAGVEGPFLLVGHSIGGLHAQVFASLYSAETAGLVLLSSTHPDQIETWLALLPAYAPDEEKAITELRAFLTSMAEDPTRNEERLAFVPSAAQARSLSTLGARPVVVATHSPRYRMVPGLSEPLAMRLETATQRLQKRFLSLSSNARQNIAATAGHGLPHEDPEFVIENILQGIALVRGATVRPK
ncbi:alpha/beta fold hydrolase [Allosphingosinicella deserti]|nr:alpha/beta hydrolase [Sphingomonas deserti]